MTSQLIGSDFTAGAQLPHYVNGRLLTAEDLAISQATLLTRGRQVARAAGHGVVDGLWVTSTTTTLTVAAGLGVASSGDTVSVGASVTLPLTFTAPATGSSAGATFGVCAPAATTGGPAITAGCYLLTALPACRLDGQAPLASTPGSTAPAGCAARWQVEGVQFKAVALPLGNALLGVQVTDANRRNLLAHWCFGSPQLATLGANLFGFPPAYGGLDTLSLADLSGVDLPLAVFYWNGQAVGFVDNWSVRRRITAPDPVTASSPPPWSPSWSAVTSDRRIADGQARLLQFEDQARDLVDHGTAGTAAAASIFPLLPPVGFLRVGVQHVAKTYDKLRKDVDKFKKDADKLKIDAEPGTEQPSMFGRSNQDVQRGIFQAPEQHIDTVGQALAAKPAEPGFDLAKFFGSAAECGGIIDWELADFGLRQSWANSPASVVTSSDAPAPLTYYFVRQNVLARADEGNAPPALYVVFLKNYAWLPGTRLPFITSPSAFAKPGG